MAQIRVFSPEGEFLNTFGQRGCGSGDFSNLITVEFKQELIYGLDAGLIGKINVFDFENEDVRSIGLPTVRNASVFYTRILSDEIEVVKYRPQISEENEN